MIDGVVVHSCIVVDGADVDGAVAGAEVGEIIGRWKYDENGQ